MGSSAWRDESWGGCERLPAMVLPWRAAEDRSRREGWRPEKVGHRLLTAAYGGHSATMTRQNVDDVEPRCLLAGTVRRRGTTVLPPADCYRQGEPACGRSDPPASTVQLTEERSDVLVPWRGKQQLRSGLWLGLKLGFGFPGVISAGGGFLQGGIAGNHYTNTPTTSTWCVNDWG